MLNGVISVKKINLGGKNWNLLLLKKRKVVFEERLQMILISFHAHTLYFGDAISYCEARTASEDTHIYMGPLILNA